MVLPLIIGTRILDARPMSLWRWRPTPRGPAGAGGAEALDAVPAQVHDAATAIGYSRTPESSRTAAVHFGRLVAGLRVVAVTNIAMVSGGFAIGNCTGTGSPRYQTNKSDQIVAGVRDVPVMTCRRGDQIRRSAGHAMGT